VNETATMASDDGGDNASLSGSVYTTAGESPALDMSSLVRTMQLGRQASPSRQAGVGREANKLEGLLVPLQEHGSWQHHHQERHAGPRTHPNDRGACQALRRARRPAVGACLGQAQQGSSDPPRATRAPKARAHDGFAALHAIIKTYGQRHESDAMRVENELRTAMQKDDEDVDDWQLRLEALNADAEEHDVQLSDKRLQLGVVR
jgi:hypothetical protein